MRFFCGIKGDTIPPPTGKATGRRALLGNGDRGGHKGWESSLSNRIKISGYDFDLTKKRYGTHCKNPAAGRLYFC